MQTESKIRENLARLHRFPPTNGGCHLETTLMVKMFAMCKVNLKEGKIFFVKYCPKLLRQVGRNVVRD